MMISERAIEDSCSLETKRMMWFLFGGTRGGKNRMEIVTLLANSPLNTNQISRELRIDYKAVQYHLNVLEKNNMITREGKRYGALYFITPLLENCMAAFDEILIKLK